MSKEFQEELNSAYEKSLGLALTISEVCKKSPDNDLISFIKKNYQEFVSCTREYRSVTKKLQPSHTKNSKSFDHQISKNSSLKKPLNRNPDTFEGKIFLNKSIEETNFNIKLTRAGKSTKNNSLQINSQRNTPDKLMSSTKIDSFKYKTQEPKSPILVKIEKCEENIRDFYKSINGLEIFCSGNPGVPWNNDKKILHKLYENPTYKAFIIKNYNDSLYTNMIKPKTNLSRVSVATKRNSSSRYSNNSILYGQRSLSPAQNPLSSILEARPCTSPLTKDPAEILKRCSERFLSVKQNKDSKLIRMIYKTKSSQKNKKKIL
jgi:hypothetical protein